MPFNGRELELEVSQVGVLVNHLQIAVSDIVLNGHGDDGVRHDEDNTEADRSMGSHYMVGDSSTNDEIASRQNQVSILILT